MRGLLVLAVVAGCGRFGFQTDDDDEAAADASSDARLVDAAPDDASGDAPPTSVCANAMLCDGFETGLDMAVWTTVGNASVDTTRAHRGSRSIRTSSPARAPNQSSYNTIYESLTLAQPGTFWVRGWFQVSALPAGTNGMELIVAGQTSGDGVFVFLFGDGTHLYSQFEQSSVITTNVPSIDTWFCVVMKVVRSTTTDGALAMSGDLGTLSLPNVQTDGSPPLDYVAFGIGLASGNVDVSQPALDVWIDDVIVDTAPITCAD